MSLGSRREQHQRCQGKVCYRKISAFFLCISSQNPAPVVLVRGLGWFHHRAGVWRMVVVVFASNKLRVYLLAGSHTHRPNLVEKGKCEAFGIVFFFNTIVQCTLMQTFLS